MIDLRAQLGPVRDQGRRGTCVAFAATANHELLRADAELLCIEFLHWGAKRRDGLPAREEGTTLAAAARTLAEAGQPPEGLWPYDDQRDQWSPTYQPPPTALTAAGARQLAGGAALPARAATVRATAAGGRAILLGLALHDPWFVVGANGQIAMPAPGAPDLGGHAVLVVGFRDGGEPGGGIFIIRNSWGIGWGEGGHGYLPFAYVDQFGLQAWALA